MHLIVVICVEGAQGDRFGCGWWDANPPLASTDWSTATNKGLCQRWL